MSPVERSTCNSLIALIDDDDIDFSFIEKELRHDIPPDTFLHSIGNNPKRRKVESRNCTYEVALPSTSGDGSKQMVSFEDQTTLDPDLSQIFEPVSLEGLRQVLEQEQIISDDEDDRPVEAFPDDSSSICQAEEPAFHKRPPAQASYQMASTTSFIRDVSRAVISPCNSDFIDPFLDQRNLDQISTDITAREIESVLSEGTSLAENNNDNHNKRFRDYQTDKWKERYQELVQVFLDTGRSAVHHTDDSKKGLARWIKRQRAQYKLRQELKPSSMTDERIQALDAINFVWDSHNTAWEDRVQELKLFKDTHNHCNVTSANCPANRSLITWVRSQRRQYRLINEGRKSNLTPKRIRQLECLGFQFD